MMGHVHPFILLRFYFFLVLDGNFVSFVHNTQMVLHESSPEHEGALACV
jgi:hypothetical protein